MTYRPTGNPNGRPSKYKPEHCERLIEHMKDGNSFYSFGSVVGVGATALKRWLAEHEEFRQAKEIGLSYELKFWEDIMKVGAVGAIPPIKRKTTVIDGETKQVRSVTITEEPGKFSMAAVRFALMNKFPKLYREKISVDMTTTESVENLTPEEIKRRKELYASILKTPKE